ncbi:MAG: SRPBCC family protein [Chitinophagales bacterium]|nr:SRPBCC family protein [Chitinophagaceae bacterium]MCB9065546.1 SRPBCC family protein [Chitinophagales bacterium]
MAIYELKREQYINAPLEDVWKFFSTPNNLQKITPDNMTFTITSPPYDGQVYNGQIITYKVAPILGIPLNWVTEIKDVVPLHLFVDEQKKGPYKIWRHKHIFTKSGNGVLMQDFVEYKPPMGILGDLANMLFIKRQLKEIFDYRKEVVDNIFNK